MVVGATNGQGFLLQNGLLTLLPPVQAGNTGVETAFGINDGGTIVGQFVLNSTDNTPGVVYSNGQFTTLNPVATALVTNAQSINQGIVDGFFSTDGHHEHGFSSTPLRI